MSSTIYIANRRTWDVDAGTYLKAVEAADAQSLEPYVAQAINQFVLGCKADGSFSAFKATCIMMGARTITGALVPLAGPAPTALQGWASSLYNRKTGIQANPGTETFNYLNINYRHETAPQSSRHLCWYVSQINPSTAQQSYGGNFGTTTTGQGNSFMNTATTFGNPQRLASRANSPGGVTATTSQHASPGFYGVSRTNSANYIVRGSGIDETLTVAAPTPMPGDLGVFARISLPTDGGAAGEGSPSWISTGRIAFYSFGEGLSLTPLDSRLTTLYNQIQTRIP